ncbi:LruC domain-containing protein [Algoriphagus limi]|uniref:LruC domain-containing protein n=1 Tax=Algoriphagus limi TaxID=2975273 RepID=A0ABT2GAW8_9BACT|nr:LruC domain-containing protein [Algoriphagus limi]MCS5491092.1 LruC domain-containing protein [Algoriphagus limi]
MSFNSGFNPIYHSIPWEAPYPQLHNQMYRFFIILVLVLASCVRVPDFEPTPAVEKINEYGTFNFSTVNENLIDFKFSDAKDNPLAGLKFELIHPESGVILLKGLTDASGVYKQKHSLPIYLDQVIIEAHFIGIPNRILVPVRLGNVTFNYRGACDPNEVISYEIDPNALTSDTGARLSVVNLDYAATYNSSGVPANLEAQRDYISSTLLNYINASLPESQPVPTYHPTYLAEGKKTTLDVIEEADVWVTFVHEGAGWRNSIGYYLYPTNQPPTSIDQIEKVTVIFPNLSMVGSGGALRSGDKIKLGRFPAGMTIGLVLFANGWSGSRVENFYYPVFADKNLNPEASPSLKQHNVLLWDEENKLFLLGFEDVRRDNAGCDQDFNDAILFVSSNPVRAISNQEVSPIDRPGTLDQDGDGINDIFDEYPYDPSKAYDSYYPSASTYGSFAFEDNWPEMGDYDFNDLVVDYQIKQVLNSSNQVTSLEPKFKFRAAGAGFRNGFGFQLNVPSSSVFSVDGSVVNERFITKNGNGTEAGQSKAVIIVTDNVHFLMNQTGFINTQDSDGTVNPKEVSLEIRFNSPKTVAELGNAPYNPFLIVNQNRGREIHLPSYSPTDLADLQYFGISDDASIPGQPSSFYKSKTALPWAIHLPESFDYPKEKQDVRRAHLMFDPWAKSNGYSYMDWFRGQTGYRDEQKLYLK